MQKCDITLGHIIRVAQFDLSQFYKSLSPALCSLCCSWHLAVNNAISADKMLRTRLFNLSVNRASGGARQFKPGTLFPVRYDFFPWLSCVIEFVPPPPCHPSLSLSPLLRSLLLSLKVSFSDSCYRYSCRWCWLNIYNFINSNNKIIKVKWTPNWNSCDFV